MSKSIYETKSTNKNLSKMIRSICEDKPKLRYISLAQDEFIYNSGNVVHI
jgi:hypothetical protein